MLTSLACRLVLPAFTCEKARDGKRRIAKRKVTYFMKKGGISEQR
jgi:hypothetical protein